MSNASGYDQESDLPPPGSRSGSGAESVLPYLTRSLKAKPAHAAEPREARPAEDKPAFHDRPGWLT